MRDGKGYVRVKYRKVYMRKKVRDQKGWERES